MSEKEKLDQISEEKDEVVEKKTKAEKAAAKKSKERAAKKSKGNRIVRWLREMRSELKKVQWPTWKTVLKNTGVVILCVVIIGACIWIFDAVAHKIIDALLKLAKSLLG